MTPARKLTGADLYHDVWGAYIYEHPYVREFWELAQIVPFITAESTTGIAHAPGSPNLGWSAVVTVYGPGESRVTYRYRRMEPGTRAILYALIEASRAKRRESGSRR